MRTWTGIMRVTWRRRSLQTQAQAGRKESNAWKRARDRKQIRDQLDGQGDREQEVSWVGGGMN